MNPKFRRFAPIGLYLALLAALVALSLYIIQREWNLYLQISLAMILVGLAAFALLDPGRVRTALTGRQARYGSNALVMSVAFLGILVVINYLGYKNSVRRDLTEDQQNTLAPETLDTLSKLPEPVTAQAFYTNRVPTESTKKLLEQYKFEGNGKFDYRFIDPEANPVAAQEAKITRDGTVVLKMGDRQQPVEFVTEKEMTGALVRLLSNQTRAVYFLTGHGEHDPDGAGNEAYASLRLVLESKNYQVHKLNLISDKIIPADARVVVVAGPMQPVSSEEVALLKSFVDNGGALIVMEDPIPTTEFGDKPDPLADYLQTDWGIKIGQDIVVDPSLQQGFVAVAAAYANHPITEKLKNLAALLPTARSVQTIGELADVTQTELVLTSDQAWGETDMSGLQSGGQVQVNPDAGVDLLGPVPLVVVAEKTSGSGRVAVFGDADFAADVNFTQYANGDLLVNTVDWSAGQEELISLTPKDSTQRVLIPPKQYTLGLIFFGFVFALPGAVLVSGIVVWVQRRKRG
jgi:ABC-type uncharacterized transport system involved in gliding motility auxiliary subunit